MADINNLQTQQSEYYTQKDSYNAQTQVPLKDNNLSDTFPHFQFEYKSQQQVTDRQSEQSPSEKNQFQKLQYDQTGQENNKQIECNFNVAVESNLPEVAVQNIDQMNIMYKTKLKEFQEQPFVQRRVQSLHRRSSTKSASKISGVNVLEDEYFGEDNSKKQKERQKLVNPDYFYKLRDHHTSWNTKVFLEMMFYHFLFYFLLGPFIGLIFFKKRVLLKNFSFWGKRNYFYYQTFIYIFNLTSLLLFFCTDSPNIYDIEIIYMELTILLRIFVISCKYATLPEEKISLYKNFVLGTNLTSNDYYFTKWVLQDPSSVYRETYNALQRGEYDPQMFYISFFVNPSEEKINEMDKCLEVLKTFHKYDDQFDPPCTFMKKSESKFFYGYGIISLLLKKFQDKNPNKNIVICCFLLAIFRGLSTLIYRFLAREKLWFSPIEVYQIVGIVINITLGYFSSFVFLVYFIRDLKMKYYLLEQCKLMLQYRKTSTEDQKIFPTIDFTNPYSLKELQISNKIGWSVLRRVLLDYGKQFYIRLQVFLTTYLILGTAALVLMVLQIYNVTNVEGSVVVTCVFEVLVILTASLYMLYRGSMINQTFYEFKNTLIDYKVLIADLIMLKDIYFDGTGMNIHNLLRRKSVEKLNLTFSQVKNQDEQQPFITKYLNQIEFSIQECEQELEQDVLNQPFTLFSIKITKTQFSSILVALGTIAGTLTQQIFKGYNEKYNSKNT